MSARAGSSRLRVRCCQGQQRVCCRARDGARSAQDARDAARDAWVNVPNAISAARALSGPGRPRARPGHGVYPYPNSILSYTLHKPSEGQAGPRSAGPWRSLHPAALAVARWQGEAPADLSPAAERGLMAPLCLTSSPGCPSAIRNERPSTC